MFIAIYELTIVNLHMTLSTVIANSMDIQQYTKVAS
jgi:hypothetical protein